MKHVLMHTFLLHSSIELVDFFGNCLVDIVFGGLKISANVSTKKLAVHEAKIEFLCKKKKKRERLASKSGTKLLNLIETSVHHLGNRFVEK